MPGTFGLWCKNTSTYQSLDSCSKDCILSVNGSLVDVDTPCVAYGCVCTDTTNGQNYVEGLANVKNCAVKSKCSDPDQATTGLADICAIYAADIAQPPVVQTGNDSAMALRWRTLIFPRHDYPRNHRAGIRQFDQLRQMVPQQLSRYQRKPK